MIGCSGSVPETATTTPPTTRVTTTTGATTTTTPRTTIVTTTKPAGVDITVSLPADHEVQAALDAFYGWIGDRTRPTPVAPEGLLAHVAAVAADGDMILSAAWYRAEVTGGSVGVATLGDDVVLLADEGDGWQIVGAHLARFGLDPWYGPPVRHVLIVGTDARPGEGQRLYRADSIHVVSSNLAAHAGSIVGFPRDTYVATSYGHDKLTHVNATSDTDELLEITRDLSGLPIEGYFITGFLGFMRLVDDLGGVVVDVPFGMAEPLSEAYLSKGIQLLWGQNALAFSRNRHIYGGDFTRSFHQGVVILAGLADVLERDITTLPELVRILLQRTWTDLSLGDVLTLGATAFEIDPLRVTNDVPPGQTKMV
ncbi:MAG: LCP family protein, partial [Acidimicrobiia bacterium]|nr:LCP family protein [Acidimicrobiia bacterium]